MQGIIKIEFTEGIKEKDLKRTIELFHKCYEKYIVKMEFTPYIKNAKDVNAVEEVQK